MSEFWWGFGVCAVLFLAIEYRGPAFVQGYKDGRSIGRDRAGSLKFGLYRALGLRTPV